jgi:hypothetical protein
MTCQTATNECGLSLPINANIQENFLLEVAGHLKTIVQVQQRHVKGCLALRRYRAGSTLLSLAYRATKAGILADVLDERSIRRVTQQNLDKTATAPVLFLEAAVLHSEVVGLLCLHGHFAFELRNVFWNNVSLFLYTPC